MSGRSYSLILLVTFSIGALLYARPASAVSLNARSCQGLFRETTGSGISHVPVIAPYEGKSAIPEAVLEPSLLARLVQKVNLSDTRFAGVMRGLPDGNYLYLISRSGELAYMNRAAIRADGQMYAKGQYVGSHEGLAISMQRAPVVGAGEFTIRGGRVLAVSNRSGTFRGGERNLAYAVKALAWAGLQPDSHTTIQDHSKGKLADPHGTVAQMVEHEVTLRMNPRLRALREETRVVMQEVLLNQDKSVQWLMSQIKRENEAFTSLHFLTYWSSPEEGEASIILRTLDKLGESRYRKVLELLRQSIT